MGQDLKELRENTDGQIEGKTRRPGVKRGIKFGRGTNCVKAAEIKKERETEGILAKRGERGEDLSSGSNKIGLSCSEGG